MSSSDKSTCVSPAIEAEARQKEGDITDYTLDGKGDTSPRLAYALSGERVEVG
jgi:hypothetical protein